MSKVSWGIVSTGRITHQFVQDFAFVPNDEVVAVASRSLESANEFAGELWNPSRVRGLRADAGRPMWTWLLPAIQKAREWVEQGRIGRLQNSLVSWANTIRFLEHMERVKERF